MTLPSDNHDLLARLRALPAQRTPPESVWQGISAALDEAPATTAAPLPRHGRASTRRRWRLPLSLAAAASLAAMAVLLLPARAPVPAPPAQAAPLLAQAEAMSGEYRQAMAALPATTVPAELQPALRDLDASAAQIRSALRERPDAGYLLGQLRRTYDKRLELTRMAARDASVGMT
ncbi:MAG TPA: hypothetical protein VM687_11515 [Stenotrophomonas sp.]|nr:hypothetical protein [Stenotrophomonas sp.]